jgi:hypothetical protein
MTTQLSFRLELEEEVGVVEEGVQDPLFPKDLFTPQQNRQGAVVLHIIGKTEYYIPVLEF